MKGFFPVFKRELRAYFSSPIAYVVLGMFLAISGYFYYNNLSLFSLISLQASQNPMLARQLNFTEMILNSVFRNMGVIFLFLTPMITMRLFAEEKKSGTIELLLTYPVKDLGVAMGKFVSALALLIIMLALTSLYPAIMVFLGNVEIWTVLAGYLGVILMGASFLALGMWLSSLTENQIIAATVTLIVLLFFWVIGWAATFVDQAMLRQIISQLSLPEHLENFAKGVIDTRDVIFYLNFIVFFIFLTLRSLESRLRRG